MIYAHRLMSTLCSYIDIMGTLSDTNTYVLDTI